ncbi:MAG: ankyrin repeat domain-containing protein [Verrucomicrobiota bacterium]|nr:ankyrin repeat domain-containing protein [Verrucomicrobiota bacterium]
MKYLPIITFGLLTSLITGLQGADSLDQTLTASVQEAILVAPALIEEMTPTKPTPEEFIKAAEAGDLAKIQSFLDAGIDVNTKLADGTTALIAAVLYKKEEVALYLLEKKADYTVKRDNRASALIFATEAGLTQVVKKMLEAGADVEERGFDGTTPMLLAAKGGHFELVKLLLDRGANVNPSGTRFTPLYMAAIKGHQNIVEFLSKNGAK